MELVSAVDMVESFLGDKGAASDTYQAWRTIRAKIAEVQKPSAQQLKAEIRSLLARYDGFRLNDGEKASGWLLHELRELSAV